MAEVAAAAQHALQAVFGAERHRSFRFAGGAIERLRYVPGTRSQHDPTVLRAIGEAVAQIAD